MKLDALDQIAAKTFEGYIVRKDLVRQFKGQYPVPTYVAEFLLGRYCASVDETEIQEGLAIVQRQLASRTVRAGEDECASAQRLCILRVNLPLSENHQRKTLCEDSYSCFSCSFFRFTAKSISFLGVFWVFFIKPCNKIISLPLM